MATTTYAYDAGHRVTGVTRYANVSSTTLATSVYSYDAADRLTAKVENGTTTSYAYDAADQLTASGALTYGYDATGNRTNAGYVTGAGNRTTSDGTWTYTYDDEGNVVKKSMGASAETWTYTFDHANRLTGSTKAATDGGAATARVTYVYDAFGNRAEREVKVGAANAQKVRFGYDGWDTAKPAAAGIENFDAWIDLEPKGEYVRRVYDAGFDGPVARQNDLGAVQWYGTDRDGSVTQLFTSSGTITATLTYDGFGTLLGGVRVDRFGYAGREWDETLGLQYNRARMYDPGTGRWLQEDPLGFGAGDVNLHRYVGNSPTNATDPSGLVSGGGWPGMVNDYFAERSPAPRAASAAEIDLLPTPREPGVSFDDLMGGQVPSSPVTSGPFAPGESGGPLTVNPIMQYDREGNPVPQPGPPAPRDWLQAYLDRNVQQVGGPDGPHVVFESLIVAAEGPLVFHGSSSSPSGPSVNPRGLVTMSADVASGPIGTENEGRGGNVPRGVGPPKTPSLWDRFRNTAENLLYIAHPEVILVQVVGEQIRRQQLDSRINEGHREAGRDEIGRSTVIGEVAADGAAGLGTGLKIVANEAYSRSPIGQAVTFFGGPTELIPYSEWDRQNEMFEVSQWVVWAGFEAAELAVGLINPCTWAGRGQRALSFGLRALDGASAVESFAGGVQSLRQGDYVGAAGGFAGAALGLFGLTRACFAAGTPILTPDGPKAIESLGIGDIVLSRDEWDAAGPVEPRAVLATAENYSPVLHVHLPGAVVRTSAEHPFFTRTRGWVAAAELRPDEEVRTYLGWVKVEEVFDTGKWEPVFNVMVEGWHTYFVGENEVSAVWVHNRCDALQQLQQSPNSARSSLRRSLGLMPGDPNRAHHAIPLELRNHPLVKDAAGRGWEINRRGNGVGLSPEQHSGSHPRYNDGVENDLNGIITRNGGLTDSAYQEFLDYVNSLTNELPKIPSPLR